jgi:hypothetical protein
MCLNPPSFTPQATELLLDELAERLLSPDHLYSGPEVLARPEVVPASVGVYAWYFSQVPGFVDTAVCYRYGDHILLYLGISPKAPPINGRPPSHNIKSPSTKLLISRRRMRPSASGSASVLIRTRASEPTISYRTSPALVNSLLPTKKRRPDCRREGHWHPSLRDPDGREHYG